MTSLVAQFTTDVVIWTALGAVALIGMIAMVSPRTFESLNKGGSHWIDTSKLLSKLDRPIDVDKYILPFSRWLGAAAVVAAVVIGILYSRS